MKRYLLELTPALSYYNRHVLTCKDIAEHLAMYNGNPNRNPNGLDIECMFKFDFHDCGLTGKWLGNTMYQFGITKNERFTAFGTIIEINL